MKPSPYKQKGTEITKVLIRDIIPRFGLPLTSGTDSGPAFIAVQELTQMLRD